MSKKIGIRLYLDGAPQFNKDIRDINSSLKEFQSELKMNQTQYKDSQNSLEALSKKSESLNKAYETAAKKVEAYQKRLEELNKARQQEQEKQKEIEKALENEKKKLEELKRAQGENSDEYKKQATVVSELEGKLKLTDEALVKFNNEEVRLNTALNNATTEQIKYENELNATNGYLEEAQKSTDGLASSIDKYGKEVDEGTEATKNISDILEKVAQNEALQKLGEQAKQLLENLMECAEVAEEFEYSIAKVQSIAHVSDEELVNMSADIRRISTEMGIGAAEVSEAVYQAISASVDASEAIGFVEDATKLARAGFTDTTTAVDVLTTAINAYGKEANSTKHIADDLITTQNLGKTTVNELAQSLGTVIPTASALNVSLDQLSSAYVIMTKQGINTANTTTYIRAMLNELSDAGSEVSKELYNLTGNTFGQLMEKGKTLGDVMQILGDSVEGNGERFKNLFGNVRAGLGALSLFNQGAEAFNDAMYAMQNNIGATDEAFAIMADTAVMTNERFEASLDNLKIAIGESVSPAIKSMKESAIEMLEPVTEFIEKHPALISGIAGVAAGIASAATAAATFVAVITTAKLVMEALSGPIGWVTMGITALAAAIGGYAGLSANSKDATDRVLELNDALQKNSEASRETYQTHQDNISHMRELADRYKELSSQAHLTDEELIELNNITTELNTTVPGCTAAYRDNKDVILENADAVNELIEGLIAEQEYQNNIQDLTQAYKDRATAQEAVSKATSELEEAEKQEQYYLQQLNDGIIEASGAYDIAHEKVRELTEAQNQAQAVYDENEQKINTLSSAVEEYTKKTEELTETEEELTDELGVVHDTMESVKAANNAIEEATKDANAAIGDQIGLFDEWNKKSDLTLEKMEKRWKDQTTGVNQYKDDLIYLKRVIDGETDPAIKDLAQHMANMGVDGAAEIHNFVEGLKKVSDNKDKVTELARTWQEHIDVISEAEGIYESIQLEEKGYTEQSKKLFDQFYSDSEKAQKDYNGKIVLLAEQGIKDQAGAIQKASPEVEKATKTVMDNSFAKACESAGMPTSGGQADKYYKFGTTLMSSMAKGINDEGGTIASALQKQLETAANKMDISGLSERINKKIGEALERAGSR
ncbi:MAG: phage tail tape measure protein [Lachnospiraceae bacterium]|nr:phage tail tape measure protein [Lachnospiraceae bacterium]